MNMNQHAIVLYQKYKATRVEKMNMLPTQACCYPNIRVAYVPPVRGKKEYLANLHELGHIVLGLASNTYTLEDVDMERKVWQWTLQHSKIRVGAEEKEFILYCLTTYHENFCIKEPSWEFITKT